MENGMVEVYKRISNEKSSVKIEDVAVHIDQYLYKEQNNLLRKNTAFREDNTFVVDSYEDFKEKVEKGFVLAHRDGTVETADKIQTETSATIRCIPLDQKDEDGKCILTGKLSKRRYLFARSY